ncbi:MAG: glycosyltransferase [Archangiaceae bacterium]|nr:glycosyltransferase [Archangiaceae bacterium]
MKLSVVVSTFDRLNLLQELLDALGRQTLSPDRFEVIVVDDGSKVPVAGVLAARKDAYRLTVVTQKNAGAAAARDAGIARATGEVVVITDDDMMLPPEFLDEHLKAHEAGYTVVLGQIAYDGTLVDKPLFERFHALQLARFVRNYTQKPTQVRGVMVCTGNVSFRRADYLSVGGFDRTLGRSEDRELGVRLQKAGARLYFAAAARTTNHSDHTDVNVWMRRNFQYGIYDSRIHKKHPDRLDANPWHFMFLVNPVSRGFLLLTVASPPLGKALSRMAYKVAEGIDGARSVFPPLEKVAIAGATLSYGIEYFRGVREEAGTLSDAVSALVKYARSRLGGEAAP